MISGQSPHRAEGRMKSQKSRVSDDQTAEQFSSGLEAESRRGQKRKRGAAALTCTAGPGTFRRSSRRRQTAAEKSASQCPRNRPLIQSPNLFLRIRAAGSMSAYGNESVSQRSSEGPTSTFLGKTLACRERFHADQQVSVSLLPPEHKRS